MSFDVVGFDLKHWAWVISWRVCLGEVSLMLFNFCCVLLMLRNCTRLWNVGVFNVQFVCWRLFFLSRCFWCFPFFIFCSQLAKMSPFCLRKRYRSLVCANYWTSEVFCPRLCTWKVFICFVWVTKRGGVSDAVCCLARVALTPVTPYRSTKFSSKIKYVSSLDELQELIPMDSVHIPECIIRWELHRHAHARSNAPDPRTIDVIFYSSFHLPDWTKNSKKPERIPSE